MVAFKDVELEILISHEQSNFFILVIINDIFSKTDSRSYVDQLKFFNYVWQNIHF